MRCVPLFQEVAHGVLTPAPQVTLTLDLRPEELVRIAKAKRKAKSEQTLRNYRRVFHQFAAWRERRGVPAAPAPVEMVEAYLTELAEANYARLVVLIG